MLLDGDDSCFFVVNPMPVPQCQDVDDRDGLLGN